MMEKKIITLCYRKIIRPDAAGAWEKMVHADSHMEFKMQAQNFSGGTGLTSYADLLRHSPDARQLPARVALSVTGYVQQLGGVVPELLNTLGRRFLKIKSYQFEIINSDLYDRDKHTVAISFFSAPLIWHHTIGNNLLVSAYPENHEAMAADEVLTDLFQLVPYLNIHSLQLYPQAGS